MKTLPIALLISLISFKSFSQCYAVRFTLNFLQKGDVLLFSNIWSKVPDGNEDHIKDARMTIVSMTAKE